MKKTKWILDPMHSEILFKVKHLMLTTVTGHFGSFKAEATTEDDAFNRTTDISFTADVDSLYTNNSQRDNHLKSPDFFNAEQYPKLEFAAKDYDAARGELKGDLTIRGITKPVIFKAAFSGTTADPYGQTKAGFSLSGKLNRKDFGLHWNTLTEAGGVVVGDEVKIFAEIQFTREAAKSEEPVKETAAVL
ncbi:MAG TPA: YceI family protein [Chitinophagaceae bacterium]|nr:YceI family protein [Chitinophagaceae bacterium]